MIIIILFARFAINYTLLINNPLTQLIKNIKNIKKIIVYKDELTLIEY